MGQSHSDEEVLSCCEQILHKYEANRKNIHFLIIEHSSPTQRRQLSFNILRYNMGTPDESRKDFNVTMGNTQCVAPIFTQYAVRNSRTLIRHKKIKRFIIRTLTAFIPAKKWRKAARRRMYGQSDITW